MTLRRLLTTIILPLAALLTLATAPARAQYVAVSAVVQDSNGTLYNNCVVNISYVPAPGATTVPTIGGSTFQTVIPVVNCDSNAHFQVSLVDNLQVSDGHTVPPSSMWNFSICSAKGAYPIQYCFNTSIVITGASQNVSAALTAAPAPLLPGPGCGGLWNATVAYPIGCVATYGGLPYTSLITNNLNHLPPSSPTAWQPGGGSGGGGACGAVWSATTSYPIGCTATYSDILYVSLTDSNLNNLPSTSPTYWGTPPTNYPTPVNVTGYGARAISLFDGYLYDTATCVGGSHNVTLTGQSFTPITFPLTPDPSSPGVAGAWTTNGDGIALFCGALSTVATPAAPTITAVLAAGPVGSGLFRTETAPISTQSVTVKIAGYDALHGGSAASPSTTATVDATLGTQLDTITSTTRSGPIETFTMAAPEPYVVGTYVQVKHVIPPNFDGWVLVDSVIDNEHWTAITGIDTNFFNADTSGTGGQAAIKAGYEVSWPNDPAAIQTVAWDSTPQWLGMSPPDDAASGELTDFLAYWGTTDSGNLTEPMWVPSAPPSAKTNDVLATTITAGAGTAAITIADAAAVSATAAPAEFDNSRAFEAACLAAQDNHAGVYTPPTGSSIGFILSAPTTCTSPLFRNGGTIFADDTLIAPLTLNWAGSVDAGSAGIGLGLPNGCIAPIDVGAAYPGYYAPGNVTGSKYEGLCLVALGNALNTNAFANPNGVLLSLFDDPYGNNFDHTLFNSGNGTHDVTGEGALFRSVATNLYDLTMTHTTILGGPGNSAPYDNTSWTDEINVTGTPNTLYFDGIEGSARGIFVHGTSLRYSDHHIQGPIMPGLTVWAETGYLAVGPCNIDSNDEAILSDVYFGPSVAQIYLTNCFMQTVDGGTYPPVINGQGYGSVSISGPISGAGINGIGQNYGLTLPGNFLSSIQSSLTVHSTAYTLTANDSWVNVTGTTTITAPHALVGQLWTVFNSGSATVTLQADSGNFNGTSSVTIPPNSGMYVTCDGTNCFGQGGVGSTFNPAIPGIIGGTTPNVVNSTQVNLPEQSGTPPGISGVTSLGAVSGNHWPAFNPNNVGARYLCGLTGSVTSGHIAAFNQSGTICDIVDGGTGTGSGTVTNFSANTITTATQNFATAGVTSPGVTPALTYTLTNVAAGHKFFMNNSGSAGAPDYESAGEADLPATTVFTDIANTFGAHLNDFSASTIKAPQSAGFTTTSTSNIGLNTTTNNWQVWANAANKIMGVWTAAPTTGHCVQALVSSSNVLLQDAGAACGTGSGPTLQTNGVNNTTQTALNFVNTAGATGITFTNPGTSTESAVIGTTTGGGNAVATMTATGTRVGDYAGYGPGPALVNITPGVAINAQTSSTYTVLSSDRGKVVTANYTAGVMAVTLPQANSTGFDTNFYFCIQNLSGTAVTITPTTSTINGAAALTIQGGTAVCVNSDNTNYFARVSGSSQTIRALDLAAQSTSTTQTLTTSVPQTGHYVFNVYQDTSAGCASADGHLTNVMAWNDGNARSFTSTNFIVPGTSATNGTQPFNVTAFSVWLVAGTTVSVTNTYTGCGTGTWTYDSHAWLVQQ